MTLRIVAGRYWRFSATPSGDKLTVRPCQNLGTFEIGPGARPIEKPTMSGTLWSKDAVVPADQPGSQQTWHIPEGDYLLHLRAEYGPLRMAIESNWVKDGTGRVVHRPEAYTIQIRKDKPFTLDFSNTPAVLFCSPAQAARVRRGESLEILAWLVDPKLDVLVFDISSLPQAKVPWVYRLLAPLFLVAGLVCLLVPRIPRTLRLIGWVPIAASVLMLCWLGFNQYLNDWKAKSHPPRHKKLEAGAVVTRANGRVVAQGDFPLTWQIPKDIALKGDEEVFTIKATFETGQLYGTVKATREVRVCR